MKFSFIFEILEKPHAVIPAKAGIPFHISIPEIPAFAGMTEEKLGMTEEKGKVNLENKQGRV